MITNAYADLPLALSVLRHPECGCQRGNRELIKLATKSPRGGCRPGAGRKPAVPVAPIAGTRWYCVQHNPRDDLLAIMEISVLGLRVHCATFVDHDGQVPRPAFPGYLFVQFDKLTDPWRDIVSRPGVKRLFSTGPLSPIPLPLGVVEQMIAEAEPSGGYIDLRPEPSARLLPETQVRVMSGPFTDFHAVCRLDEGERVRLLVTIFGRSTSVVMARNAVEPLE